MGGTELEFVQAAFASNYIAPLGPMVDAFEKEFGEMLFVAYTYSVTRQWQERTGLSVKWTSPAMLPCLPDCVANMLLIPNHISANVISV